MGELINLRRQRKARAKREVQAQAAINRAAFGRGKAAKAVELLERHAAAQALDGHLRQRPDDD